MSWRRHVVKGDFTNGKLEAEPVGRAHEQTYTA